METAVDAGRSDKQEIRRQFLRVTPDIYDTPGPGVIRAPVFSVKYQGGVNEKFAKKNKKTNNLLTKKKNGYIF